MNYTPMDEWNTLSETEKSIRCQQKANRLLTEICSYMRFGVFFLFVIAGISVIQFLRTL